MLYTNALYMNQIRICIIVNTWKPRKYVDRANGKCEERKHGASYIGQW